MKINNSWFSLIEMLIAITIFFIIVIMTYVNYAFYQNIASVRIWVKEVSQSISEARNMAINWFDKNWINQSVIINFDTSNNQEISFYSVYHTWSINDIDLSSDPIKIRQLHRWIEFCNFSWWYDNIFILFNSISWVWEIYNYNWYSFLGIANDISFDISYKWATLWPLKKEITYYKNTNVIDY